MSFKSANKFSEIEGLPACALESLEKDFGYEHMSSAQALYLQAVVNGQDILVRAGTGTGKTLGFLLPLVTTLLSHGPGGTAVVISPARELAEQTMKQAERIALKCEGVVVESLVGGIRSSKADAAALRTRGMGGEGLLVLVATPGRLLDHIDNTPGFKEQLANTGRVLVLDEIDRLIDPGFRPAVARVATVMSRPDRQTLLFTATATKEVRDVARTLFARADDLFIDAGSAPGEGSAGAAHNTNVQQEAVLVPAHAMIDTLVAELEAEVSGRSVVFVQTAAMAALLAQVLRKSLKARQHHVYEIHSRLTQPQRSRAVRDFSEAPPPAVMVATDVFARGLDVRGVTLVLQLGIAPDNAQVAHRVGRTGRGGESGRGLMILEEREAAVLSDLIEREKMPIQVRENGAPRRSRTSRVTRTTRKSHEGDRSGSGCRAFIAAIGFYKSQLKRLKWKVADMVPIVAEMFAPLGVASPAVCPVPAKTLKKMGLSADHGLTVRA